MLQNTLYFIKNIQKLENNSLLSTINLNDKDTIFKGHFPGQPVLPGVCLMNMITDVVSGSKKDTYYLKYADSIKFINLVDPFLFPSILITIRISSETSTTIQAEAVISYENSVFLKFKGGFERILI